jgi:putative sugar O-methyltransferase
MNFIFVLFLILLTTFLNAKSTSFSDSSKYLEVCQKAAYSDEFFKNFKTDADYQLILEHVSRSLGTQYLSIIKSKYPCLYKNIDKLKINDFLGGPILYNYPEIGNISPTTLRYIKVAGDLESHFGSLDNRSIVEIGAGYGGQALILNTLYKISAYHIFDLLQPLLLQKKYLESHQIKNIIFHNGRICNVVEDYDIVISNYAFSECIRKIQSLYLRNVIQYARFGYMTMNELVKNSYTQDELSQILNNFGFDVAIIPEEPKTSFGNYIIIFKKGFGFD